MADAETKETMTIPLWINGHAYLTLASGLFALRSPVSGAELRRVPLCGIGEALEALRAAQQAVAVWQAAGVVQRTAVLAQTGEALAGYAAHFSGLIAEESGRGRSDTDAEVAQAVALLKAGASPAASTNPAVLAVLGDAAAPLLGVLVSAAPLLTMGSCLIVKPSPQTASVMVALAELMTRNGMPDGVFNVVHGDDTMIASLRAAGLTTILPGA